MRWNHWSFWFASLSLVVGCSSSPAQGTGGSVPSTSSPQSAGTAEVAQGELSPAIQGGPQAPVVAGWELASGEVVAGTVITLRLRLERTGHWGLPISITVTVPEGARVVQGEVQQTVAANAEPGVAVLEFDVAIDHVPQDDLVAIIDSRNEGAGFHAEPHYRFGRPEPETQAPVRDGPRVRVGEHDLGPTIMMPPPPQDRP